MLAVHFASTSGESIVVGIVGTLLFGAIAATIILYFSNDRFHDALVAFSENRRQARAENARCRAARDVIPLVDESTYHAVMANVSAQLTQRGFIPQTHQPGLYTYVKNQRPSILLALILFFICFIPGVIYLIVGGGNVIVTVRITQVPQGYHFSATGPAKTVVRQVIRPYTIQPDILA